MLSRGREAPSGELPKKSKVEAAVHSQDDLALEQLLVLSIGPEQQLD